MSIIPISPGTSTSHSHHHRGHRLRNFMLPNGRKVHIAPSPEEADLLRRRLSTIEKDQPFDLVINGSPEHLDALRTAHTHHESKRQALKDRHGDAYDEFENVKLELDILGSELHMLTDHSVALDANFSKYGYSAELRTYDDGSEHTSRASSMYHGPDDHEKKDWAAEKRKGRIMKLYKKPTVRQYFHRGLLWRASGTTEVASFELFVDLLYVGILAINGDHASENPTGYELLRFVITFIMSWKIWSDLTLVVSWFETDDIAQRVSMLFVMACLLGLTTNILEAFEDSYTMLVAFYLTARLFMGSYFLFLAWCIPMVRGMLIFQAIIIMIPSIIWIGSIYVDLPQRFAIIAIAIFIDLTGAAGIIFLVRSSKFISTRLAEWTDRVFEFYPATNIEHKTERTNAFVTLVFGYSVVAIIYQNAAPFGLNAFFGKAVLGLIQAFVFNWIYFDLDGTDLFAHAIRRDAMASIIWNFAHLPFIMSYVLGGAALSRLVVARDCGDASLESLTEAYQEKSESEISDGLRWFYCVGFGVALFFMGMISACHIHKKDHHGIRLAKRYRLLNRLIVCIILICLPLSSLNSLALVSTVTGLVVWVLVLELWGHSCPDETFFGGGKKCAYTAKCKISRKDLEEKRRMGEVLKLKELGGGEEGVYEGS
ncbi:hypothetical protein BofuT4P330000033001 [Botrytis cinerea T4]|uniref:Low temperature requirement a protein n=1 Tax=Botryotinia fuckeliana (strain T4) TaxID=999810 RepID=G2Y139_BOTF4|nr:hypothetical protein BofuT4P330000033001 [Botrytis cinerea T4]